MHTLRSRTIRNWFLLPATLAVLSASAYANGNSSRFTVQYLESDIPGAARFTDPNLINAWGLVATHPGFIWVAAADAGVAVVYNANGRPVPPFAPLVVSIPPPAGSPTGTVAAAPTGIAYNDTPTDFQVTANGHTAKSSYLFATEDGTIAAYSRLVDATHAVTVVDNSASEASYKGIAIAHSSAGNFLLAANFHQGRIDAFDRNFAPVAAPGGFTDPTLPTNYAPFNVYAHGGEVYVAYALQDEDAEDEVAGPGNGFVDVYDTSGTFVRRLVSGGALNAPWGMAIAPGGFGRFGGKLLVGNFGDGWINAYNVQNGSAMGELDDPNGAPIAIDGLWGISFGGNALFFAAGPEDEEHGLFGRIMP